MKDCIESHSIDITVQTVECVGVKITLSPQMSFIILAVYRPPNSTNHFYSDLVDILKPFESKEVLMMGDLNLNWLDKTKKKKLKDIANSVQMTQIITKPTRLTKSSQTLIDLIFTTKPDRVTKTYNLITGLSDHNLTLVARKLNKSRHKTKQHSSAQIPFVPKRNHTALKNDLNEIDWEDKFDSKCCDSTCNNISLALKNTIAKYTQLKQKRSNKINLPWFNSSLWNLMKQRDLALKVFLKSKLNTDHYIFKSLRNKVVMKLRKSKANFYLNMIKEAKGNSKNLWRSMD